MTPVGDSPLDTGQQQERSCCCKIISLASRSAPHARTHARNRGTNDNLWRVFTTQVYSRLIWRIHTSCARSDGAGDITRYLEKRSTPQHMVITLLATNALTSPPWQLNVQSSHGNGQLITIKAILHQMKMYSRGIIYRPLHL